MVVPSRAALILGFLISVPIGARACCGIAHGASVIFADQTNIVVWDEKTGTEHFIRAANFVSGAKSFDFIAPTPTKPEISIASKDAFQTLAALQPQTHEEAGAMVKAGIVRGGVSVLQVMDVGGYHATSLMADDAAALAAWMKQNGYVTTPSIQAWTQPYIDKHWVLTAFRVQNPSEVATTGTLRMSFKTDRPYNPYRVPSDNIDPSHFGRLKVYFVANRSYEGFVGAHPWSKEDWEAPIPDSTANRLASQLHLPASAIPAGAQVQVFQSAFPAPADDDIDFTPASSNIRTAVVWGGLATMILATIGGYQVARKRVHH